MARLWSCGFELQTTAANVELDSITGVPTINTTTKRSGSAALRSNPTAGSQYFSQQYKTAGTANNDYLRFYLYIASSTNTAATAIALFRSTTSGNLCSIRLNTNNTIRLQNEQTSAQLGSDSSALTGSTWYRIELVYDRGAATATAYIDGVSFATGDIVNTLTTSDIRIGTIDSCTADLYFDDIAVNDSTGSFQTGLPGAGSIVHLLPNAAGDNNAWATNVGGTAGAANNFTRVSEVTPDDATSYNGTNAANTIDDYNITNISGLIGASDSINVLHIGMRFVSSGSAGATVSVTPRIKATAAGTVETGTATSPSGLTWRTNTASGQRKFPLTIYDVPGAGTTAIVGSDLDNYQIGMTTATTQTNAAWVSTMWLVVDYTPGVALTPVTDPAFYKQPTSLPSSHYTKPIIEMY